MIEQTEMVVDEWIYLPSTRAAEDDRISADLEMEVMKKSAPTKKGLAFRHTCKFKKGKDVILLYVAQDSYVIDLEDRVDLSEILTMIRNSYSKFREKFEFRSLGTELQNKPLPVLDEFRLDVKAILALLDES